MEQAILALLTGDLSTMTLLLLFILGILTKRFVPWWTYEEVVEELKRYEEQAPKLLDEVTTLIDEIRDRGYESHHADRIEEHTSEIKTRRRRRAISEKRTRDGVFESARRRGEPDE